MTSTHLRHLPDTIQTLPDVIKHHPDTCIFGLRETIGRKGNRWIPWYLFNCFQSIWHLPTPDICQKYSDSIQTLPYLACGRPLEEKAIAEYHDIQIAVLNLFFFLAVLSAYVSYSQWANGENHYDRGEIFLVVLRSGFFSDHYWPTSRHHICHIWPIALHFVIKMDPPEKMAILGCQTPKIPPRASRTPGDSWGGQNGFNALSLVQHW